jgi:AhpD family alkylhydroperoxidase
MLAFLCNNLENSILTNKKFRKVFVESKKAGRRYSIGESYTILYNGLRTIHFLTKAKKAASIKDDFIERIMLAVTEVNGCAMCSYAHTKMALEKGMSNDEIQSLLSGDLGKIPEDELPAIMFAQHYAETRGKPSKKTWDRILETYGREKALGILAATRMIMVGNAFGIVLGSFKNRLKGISDTNSSLAYELGMLLAIIPFIILTLIHRILAFLIRKPIISF